MPHAVLCLAAGVGVGWLARAVLGRFVAGLGIVALVLGVAAGGAFAAPDLWHLRDDLEAIRYQAKLSGVVPGLIARAGGAERLRACGDVYTGPFQVPLVAWYMHVHTTQIESTPAIRPAVVFRTKSIPNSTTTPTLRGLGDPTDLRTLSVAAKWRIVAVCKAGP
jgi:hypothetical protein